jgi:hypothetical protein
MHVPLSVGRFRWQIRAKLFFFWCNFPNKVVCAVVLLELCKSIMKLCYLAEVFSNTCCPIYVV